MTIFTQLAAPQDVTPGGDVTDGNWHTVDVTSYVSNANGVLIRLLKTGTGTGGRTFSVRRYGDTNTIDGKFNNYTAHQYFAVGIDAQDRFEFQAQNTTHTLAIELIGYFDATGTTFASDPAEHNVSSTSTWEDWDLTSLVGGDAGSLQAAIVVAAHDSTTGDLGIRANGSTDSFATRVDESFFGVAVVKVDSNDIIEVWSDSTGAGRGFYLVGWITSGVTMNTNATDVSLSTTGAWTDLSGLGSDIEGAFIIVESATNYYSFGLRPDGDADYATHYADLEGGLQFMVVGAVSDIVEGYIEHGDVNFYLLGTIDAAGAPSGDLPPLHFHHRHHNLAG